MLDVLGYLSDMQKGNGVAHIRIHECTFCSAFFFFFPPRGIFRPNQWPPESGDDAVHSLEIHSRGRVTKKINWLSVLSGAIVVIFFCGEAPVTCIYLPGWTTWAVT